MNLGDCPLFIEVFKLFYIKKLGERERERDFLSLLMQTDISLENPMVLFIESHCALILKEPGGPSLLLLLLIFNVNLESPTCCALLRAPSLVWARAQAKNWAKPSWARFLGSTLLANHPRKAWAFCLKVSFLVQSTLRSGCLPGPFCHIFLHVMYVWATTLASPSARHRPAFIISFYLSRALLRLGLSYPCE